MITVEYVLSLNHTFKGILLVEHLCHFGVLKLSIFRSNSKKLYNMFMAPKGSNHKHNCQNWCDMSNFCAPLCQHHQVTHVGLVNCYYHKDRF